MASNLVLLCDTRHHHYVLRYDESPEPSCFSSLQAALRHAQRLVAVETPMQVLDAAAHSLVEITVKPTR